MLVCALAQVELLSMISLSFNISSQCSYGLVLKVDMLTRSFPRWLAAFANLMQQTFIEISFAQQWVRKAKTGFFCFCLFVCLFFVWFFVLFCFVFVFVFVFVLFFCFVLFFILIFFLQTSFSFETLLEISRLFRISYFVHLVVSFLVI